MKRSAILILFLSLAGAPYVFTSELVTPVQAQDACARALMMAGETRGRFGQPNEERQKRMLEEECQNLRLEDKNRQLLAQNRIAARSAWTGMRQPVRECIDKKLEYDGRSVEQLISAGIPPSDEAIKDYRVQCVMALPQ